MKVRFTSRALTDLDDLFDFIARDSKVYAGKTIDELMKFSRNLAKFPDAGLLVIQPDGTQVRERYQGQYRVTYRVVDNFLEIITVQHTARNRNSDPYNN